MAAAETQDRWQEINRLGGGKPEQWIGESDNSDGGPARRFEYAGATPVQWWRLDGAGNTVSSRTVTIPSNALSGVQNRDIEFAEVAWAFFAARLP